MQIISVEVVPMGNDSGPFRAGMAIVKLNGKCVAKLRTSEDIEFVISEPEITIKKP